MHGDDKRTAFLFGLIEKKGIASFVETGTYAAATTRLFAPKVRRAWTCESYRPRYLECLEYCKGWNITLSPTPSPAFLDEISPDTPVMFYLDAHWEDHWPLPDELRKISEKWPRSIVVVDDCFVPGHANFRGCHGGGGAAGAHLGGRKTVDSRPLDVHLIERSITAAFQIIFPSYGGDHIGYSVLNGLEKIEVPEGFFEWKGGSA